MARMARVVVPGVPHHVIQRGVRRQSTFFKPNDYQFYIDLATQYAAVSKTEVWAYCLMPNHVHFVLVPSTPDGLRKLLSEVHRRYTTVINKREGWTGHLWQERFRSYPMDKLHLISAVRYIELNPVKANLCRKAEDWIWSSANAHLANRDDKLLNVAAMLELVDDWKSYLGNDKTEWTRDEIIEKHSRTGRPLGDEQFIEKLEAITGRELRPKKPGPK